MKLKKLLKKIKKGDRDSLLALFDYALDEYHEDAYNNGYKSFQADAEVHAARMAAKIHEYALNNGQQIKDNMDFSTIDEDETAKVINEYLQNDL